jgi:hypothetical protein
MPRCQRFMERPCCSSVGIARRRWKLAEEGGDRERERQRDRERQREAKREVRRGRARGGTVGEVLEVAASLVSHGGGQGPLLVFFDSLPETKGSVKRTRRRREAGT